MILQYLIGNADAHGKNVSFFCYRDGLAIAPFYDLVSVVQYSGLGHELAMGYGDEFILEEISPYVWADFAKRTGLPRSYLTREMTRMANSALKEAPRQAALAIYTDDERELVSRVSQFVITQAQKLRDAAQAARVSSSTMKGVLPKP